MRRSSDRRGWNRTSLLFCLAAAAVCLGGPAHAQTKPDLADAPRYRLWDNRARLRVEDGGLVVSFSAEGFRGYDLALRDVWGPAAPTRRLLGAARLHLPWPGGVASVTARFSGTGRLAVGKRRAKLSGRARPTEQVVTLGEQPAGEIVLDVEPSRDFALAELRLTAPSAAACPKATAAAFASQDRSFGGARAFVLTVEVPAAAALTFSAVGGRGSISARDESGARRELWRGQGDGRRRTVALELPPQIVELSFHSDGCDVRWQDVELGSLAAAPAEKPAPRAKHLVLLVVDTLRADRLPDIATTRVRTPRLSAALAAGGLVGARHLAVAPSSPPSHATIHTGLLPRVHGAVGDTAGLAASAPVVSALLRERGFFTGYVGNNDFAMGRLAKAARWDVAQTPVFHGDGIDCAPLVARGLALLREAKGEGKRAFVTLLPMEPHVPYRYHPGITERYFAGPYPPPLRKRVTSAHLSRIKTRGLAPKGWEQLRALYDGEVTYFDECFGALEDGLAALGLAEDTVIILTSDHGEGMGERGNNTGHAYSLHHELLWVPLLMFGGPLGDGKVARVASATSNLDVAPTVLELLGEAAPADMQGQSLMPLLRAQPRWPRAVVAEYGKAYAVSAGRWHYVADYQGRGKLYDVAADPAQLTDRSADAPVPLRHLREVAAIFLSQRTRWRGAWGSWGALSAAHPWAKGAP